MKYGDNKPASDLLEEARKTCSHPFAQEECIPNPTESRHEKGVTREVRLAHELGERVKELNCLYGLSRLIETPNISLPEMLQGTVALLPPAWQYPSIACARLVWNDQVYQTANFQETTWRQSRTISVGGSAVGSIELDYLELPPSDGNVFLEEEEALIQALAERLGHLIGRVQTESVLHENESRLKAIVQATRDAILMMDASGRISFWNPAAELMFGYTANEAIGQDLHELLAPNESYDAYRGAFPRFRDTGKGNAVNRVIERAAMRKNGDTIPVELSVAAVHFDNGWHAVGILRDITDRKQAEEDLRSSQEHHQSILMTSMEGYWLVDHLGRLQEVNEAYCQMSGYSAPELLQKSIGDIDAVMSKREIRDRMERIVTDGRARFETRHRRKNGTVFDVEVCAQQRPEQGQTVCFLRDISERKRTERIMSVRLRLLQQSASESLTRLLQIALDEAEALTESQAGFYHSVDADQVHLTLQAWSTNTIQHLCSAEAAGAHYPIDQAGVWGDCIRQRKPVIHNDYASLPHSKGLPKGHATVKRELVVPVFRSGTIVAVLGVGNKPTDYNEHDVEMLVSLADFAWEIGERKRAEEEHAKLQSQLYQSQKMEAIGHLAGGVAHDFNNLLQVVLVNTELAREQTEPESESWQILDEVHRATERATELTRQLLAFSRRQVMQPVRTDLNRLLQGTVKMLRRLIGEHIELCTVWTDPLCAVCVDRGQIEQVVMNLCVNARDAMPRGGRLTIETRRETLTADFCRQHPLAKLGVYAMIKVTDTGEGMDAETRARVFEPFFTTKPLGQGTGLGLASVYGIVSQHAGFINVYSELGTGSVFSVYLPITRGSASEAPAKSKPPIAGGTETILVAEDDPGILKTLNMLLRAAGYTVLKACDGREALRLFEEHTEAINLVMLDVMMPGLSGRCVMKHIQERGHHVPFLFSSGYSENAIHTDFVIEEGLNLIQKPYGREVLLREVRRVLDDWRVENAPEH